MIEDLVIRIKSITDGKTIHTRGKAIFYIEKWKNDTKRVERLINACEKALINNDWNQVKAFLRSFW